MRASINVLGPLITRALLAEVALPGGDAIGSRGLDFHINGLTEMGAEIYSEHGFVIAKAPNGLKGANITLEFPSVGATENIMMAAALAYGDTYIENAAQEPEIVNLADTLRLMGVPIKGDGTPNIRISGQNQLHTAQTEIIPDRIEAATFLIAGIITKGAVTVSGIDSGLVDSILLKLEEAGASLEVFLNEITAKYVAPLRAISVKTMPYPGFPTDTQPQLMAALSLAAGTSVIHESVFDSRLQHISEFKKMGAKIELQDTTAIITGVTKLIGAEVHASNLRAGAALILLGLAAEGETMVCDLQHVWRGYENLVDKLRSLGADIKLVE